ncbi:MAG: bifunctional folylpolyglutamate synthase/dihydrofolate synthase [Myxococcales bacterium]|nr:bifunctional folylpolyglutamate synthase/dihydrofolate synthase [Myxococcales bacterium]
MSPAYRALLERLLAARRAGIVLGLDRVTAVLARLGHPERRLGLVAHVGGTNGKGSTAAMVAALAAASGRRTALYGSPHLASLRERFVVDGAPAAEDAVVAAGAAVAAAGGDALTFFEQVTAMAFVLFAEAGVEVAVLEVGLGGRLDATNVVAAPVAAVTGVALDHQALLGADLAAIAGEKAGIFKPGQDAVIGRSGEPEAVPLLRARARAAGARVRVVTEAEVAAAPTPGLAGAHQRANAACALAVVEALARLEPGLVRSPDEQARALAAVRHPGRLEVVAAAPTVLLDGAHNPHAAAALARDLAARPERPRVLVLAVSADKDVAGIARPLVGAVERVIASRYAQARGLDPETLAAVAGTADLAPSLDAAVDQARALAGPGGLVVVAGSLYAVGEVRPRFVPMPVDPVAVSDPSPSPPSPPSPRSPPPSPSR